MSNSYLTQIARDRNTVEAMARACAHVLRLLAKGVHRHERSTLYEAAALLEARFLAEGES